jgi:S-adenosylmethionine-diacylgycerolhomoserine-N-methlytransferase
MALTTNPTASATPSRTRGIESYYKLHACIYDATRWSFLFGRNVIVARAATAQPRPAKILEIGCGTGRNLVALARRFPDAQLTGVDLSGEMLAIARRKTAAFGSRVTLMQRAYGPALKTPDGYDLVLCSYALSMFNPGYEQAIAAACHDLSADGCFALVDFHATRFRWFSRWMGVNHVRMDGQLRPRLRENLEPVTDELHSAYGGVWQYLLFLGRRKPQP